MKEPKDFSDDPRLTAYALGELEGDERAAVEAALTTDAAARAAVDEIRATARRLEAALAFEAETENIPLPVAAKRVVPYRTARKLVPFPYWLVGGLAAACFAVVLVLHEQTVEQQERAARAARRKAELLNHVEVSAEREVALKEEAEALEKKKEAETVAAAIPRGYTEVILNPPAVANNPPPQVADAGKTALIAGSSAAKQSAEEDTIKLQTFEVSTSVDRGYRSANLASATRVNAPIAGVDNSVGAANNPPPQVAAGKTAAPAGVSAAKQPAEEETIELQTFEVNASVDHGYRATPVCNVDRVNTSIAGVNNSVGYALPARAAPGDFNTEAYAYHADSDFLSVAQNPLSTFALDVNTASYANVRRFLQADELPPADAVRIEELVNYFPYAYAAPPDDVPLAATLEVAAAPWAPTHRLVRIGLKAREVAAGGTLVTVAKDVKVQVEFNPAKVQSYRLIGYNDRPLKNKDFYKNVIPPAGNLGAGRTVTALYEIVPAGAEPPATPGVDALKYQKVGGERREARGQGSEAGDLKSEISNPEILTVKVRYTPVEGGASRRLEFPLTDHGAAFADASMDFKFAAAVAGFGMVLRDSPHKGTATLAAVEHWAGQGLGPDAGGPRAEFIRLVHQAEKLRE